MSGWVSIPRGIFEDKFFAREQMSEREAWIWLIANACWKESQHRVGGKSVIVPRGAFYCTLRELQTAFGWRTDKRVRGFLGRLRDGRRIDLDVAASKTRISICDYNDFQGAGRSADANGTQARRTKEEETKNKDSVADATGMRPDSQKRASLAKATFERGVNLLCQSGVAEREARQIIGKWRNRHGDDTTLATILACEESDPTDPVSWITARLRQSDPQEIRINPAKLVGVQ